jgi:5-methylthioadenosine/S-adenosylhomocysteine deaminase
MVYRALGSVIPVSARVFGKKTKRTADHMNQACLFSRIILISPTGPDTCTIMPEAWVAVRDGLIQYAGLSETDARQTLAGINHETYSGSGKILLPALANTHGHLAMTLLRNQADDRNLQDWLFNVIFPRETRLNESVVHTGTLLGIAEMIRSGTGAAADMYYYSDAVAAAALETGFRLNFCCDTKTTAADGRSQVSPEILHRDLSQYHRHPSGLLRVSLLVHSVYLYDAAIYPELAETARSADCPVQVHVAETRREVEECLQKYGCRPPCQLEKFGFFQTPTIASHCVFLNDEDREILARNRVLAAHNPSSNLKLGSGIADLTAMLLAGMTVGLGTDGAASNNNLDLYREMRLASFLAKGSTGDAAAMPAGTILDMATRQGMAGLGFAGSGRIAAGCAADLQIVDTARPSMTPLGNPVSALIYSADSGCVESLMVDGRWLMRKRELLTLDEEKVIKEAETAARYLNNI